MYKVSRETTIASVTELRRRTAEVMERADDGSVIVVQKDNEPRGVYLSFDTYQRLLERLDRLESLELAQVALARKAAVERGEMGTTSLAAMIDEFAPQLSPAAKDPEGG